MAQTPFVHALAEYASGLACGTAGEATAVEHLEAALAAFVAAGLPYDAARTRLALARHLAHLQPQVSVAELAPPSGRSSIWTPCTTRTRPRRSSETWGREGARFPDVLVR